MARTHYEVLGIERTASTDEVRKSFKRRALETHPDKLRRDCTEGERRAAVAEFRRVHEAFEVLSDMHKRQAYDFTLPLEMPRKPKSKSSHRHSMFVGDAEESHLKLMAERQAWARSFKERSDALEREQERVAEAKARLAEIMAKDAARSPRRNRRSQLQMDEYAKMFVEVLRESFEKGRKANLQESSMQSARTQRGSH